MNARSVPAVSRSAPTPTSQTPPLAHRAPRSRLPQTRGHGRSLPLAVTPRRRGGSTLGRHGARGRLASPPPAPDEKTFLRSPHWGETCPAATGRDGARRAGPGWAGLRGPAAARPPPLEPACLPHPPRRLGGDRALFRRRPRAAPAPQRAPRLPSARLHSTPHRASPPARRRGGGGLAPPPV